MTLCFYPCGLRFTYTIDDPNKPYRVIVILSNKPILFSFGHHLSAIAQLEEHLTVNQVVTSSILVGGVAFIERKLCILIFTSRLQYDENCVVSIASQLMQLRSLNFGLRRDDDCVVGFAS